MPKLSIYVDNNFVFKIRCSPHITLRQLIAEITATIRDLSTESRIREGFRVPMKLRNFTPVMCDSNGMQLFRGKAYNRSQLNMKITSVPGLNLSDGDILYIDESSQNPECNLALLKNCGSFGAFFTEFGNEELMRAATIGDLAFIERMLTIPGILPDFVDRRLLWAAIRYNQIATVTFLLKWGANIQDLIFEYFWSLERANPITLAMKHGHLDMVKLLVKFGAALTPCRYEYITHHGITLEREAAILQYVLDNGAPHVNFPRFQAASHAFYVAPFFKFALRNSLSETLPQQLLATVFSYIELPTDHNAFQKNVQQFYTNLFLPVAAFERDFKALNLSLPPQTLKQQVLLKITHPMLQKELITLLNTVDGQEFMPEPLLFDTAFPLNNNPVDSSASHTIRDILQHIVAHYDLQSFNQNDAIFKKIDPFFIITEVLNIEAKRYRLGVREPVDQLLSQKLLQMKFGANLEKWRTRDQALHQAVLHNQVTKVEQLLEQGASLNTSIYYDYPTTPMHLAALHGHQAVAELLIKQGADLTLKGKLDKTPLELAKLNKHNNIVALLLINGAYPIDKKTAAAHVELYAKPFVYTLLTEILIETIPSVLLKLMFEYVVAPADFDPPNDFFHKVTHFFTAEFQSLQDYKKQCKELDNIKLQPKAMRTLVNKKIASRFLKEILTTDDRETFNIIYNDISKAFINETLIKHAIDIEKQRPLTKDQQPALCMALLAIRFGGHVSRESDETMIKNLIKYAQRALSTLSPKKQGSHPLFAMLSFLKVIHKNLMPSATALASSWSRSGLLLSPQTNSMNDASISKNHINDINTIFPKY